MILAERSDLGVESGGEAVRLPSEDSVAVELVARRLS
jgi:hypothetical protein